MTTVNETSDVVLRSLLDTPQPVSSVYYRLEARPELEEAAELRWQALADRLTAQGADTATVRTLTSRALTSLPGSGTLAAFAAGGELLYATEMPGARQGDLAVHGPLPHLVPLMEWRQDHPAHVLAVVDRTGADLEAYPEGTTEAIRETVTGTDDEIERNAPGGWSQMRYQHRAEDSWEHNAVRVAEALSRAVAGVSARLVLLAGDVRAMQYLTKHLPKPVLRQASIRSVNGGRSRDGAARERATQVEAETQRAAREETRDLLRRMAEQRRPGGRTVEGVRPTLASLARGRVGTLVLTHDPLDRRTAWFGPEPTHVSDRRRTLTRAGGPTTRAHLADVAVRAALLTGADVRILEPDTEGAPGQGMGALCRYA
jgi:hypothetical protein